MDDLLLRHILDYAFIVLSVDGVVTRWSAGAERLLGYSEQEALGLRLETFCTPEDMDRGKPQSELQRAAEHGRSEDDGWAVHKDGARISVEGVMHPIRGTEGGLQGFVQVLRNITAEREAKRREAIVLEVSQIITEAEDLSEAAPRILEAICRALQWDWAGLWLVDQRTDELALSDIWHSSDLEASEFESASRQLRLARGVGLPGRVWQTGEAGWIADVAEDHNFPRKALAERAALRAGLCFPLRTAGRVIAVMEFFSQQVRPRDEAVLSVLNGLGSQIGLFAERTYATQALRESEARYRVLVNTSSDAVVLIDQDGTILLVNPVVEALFGYSIEELLGQPLALLIPEHLRTAHSTGLQRYLTTKVRTIRWSGVELPGRHRDGSEIPLEIAFGELVEGNRPRFVGYARDISDRKRAEADRADLERLRDEWVTIIAHDLRQPLTAIRGYTERLARLPALREASSEERESLTHIKTASQNLEKMISDLLDVSQLEAGRLRVDSRPVHLVQLISEVIERMDAGTTASRIELKPPEGDVSVRADPARFEQVLINLLSNATKYSEPGTLIQVSIDANEAEVLVSVMNEGPGIEEDEQSTLFSRFRRTRSAETSGVPGLGLGLYLSRLLVEAQGGRIWVSSVPGGTTAFSFTVPRA